MIKFNSIQEILEFAVNKEREAHQFYTVLAELAGESPVHELLESLAADELRHQETVELELMKQGLVVHSQEPLRNFYIQQSEDEADFNVSFAETLLTAIQKEDMSFRLYVRLAGKIEKKEFRDTIIALAQEEAKHKVLLEMEYDQITQRHK